MTDRKRKSTESQEMYLKTIYLLSKKKSSVRAVDIVEELGYAKSSVSYGVHALQNNGFVVIGADDQIAFTEEGRKKAAKIYERYEVFKKMFEKMGVPSDQAQDTACQIEHDITDEVFNIIKEQVLNFDNS
jgi:Mn-dependent DtxR family transcriptional regulator